MCAERLGQGGPVRHVHLQEADIASCGGDLFHRGRAGGTGLRQAASQQPYLSGTAGSQVGGQRQAQVAQATSDEIGRLPADAFVPGGKVVAYDDLADMASFEHVAEGRPWRHPW